MRSAQTKGGDEKNLKTRRENMDNDNKWTEANRRKWRQEHNKEVTKTFNRFAGKSVNPANPNDPVLEEMRREATMHYSHLRLVPEGTPLGDDPSKLTRISAELASDGKGNWKIGNRFSRF
jgi:hypothetical protein